MWRRTCAQRRLRPRRLFQPWVQRLLRMRGRTRKAGRADSSTLALPLVPFNRLADRTETRRVAAPSRPNPKFRGDAAELVFPLRKGESPTDSLAEKALARAQHSAEIDRT